MAKRYISHLDKLKYQQATDEYICDMEKNFLLYDTAML